MTSESVLVSVDGPIATVTLNRPDKLNGVDFGILDGLVEASRRIRRDRDVRAVILQGAGPSFCAGLDFAAVGPQRAKVASHFLTLPWRSTNAFQEAVWAWRELPVPVVAVTRGHVYGAGIQLAVAADFRFTTPDAQWSVLEAKWGLVPDMGGTVPLRELVGADVAKRLVLTGEVVSGEQAVEIGLASGVADDPMKPALELVDQILARSPDSVAAGKKMLNALGTSSLRSALRRERIYQLRMFRSANTAIARKAGLKREEPRFGPRTFG